jgi:hypothetical protein
MLIAQIRIKVKKDGENAFSSRVGEMCGSNIDVYVRVK